MTEQSKPTSRRFSRLDRVLILIEQGLRTSYGRAYSPTDPAESLRDQPLDTTQRRQINGLMRVNHVGEVCAQALYRGQALTAKDAKIRHHLQQAAAEESEHLAWCQQRLDELGGRPSRLNPLWYAGAFTIGALTGLAGDARSLGFVVETERQVEAHLQNHLERLPTAAKRSRATVARMAKDEARHALQADQAGGLALTKPIQRAMHYCANVMRWLAYRI